MLACHQSLNAVKQSKRRDGTYLSVGLFSTWVSKYTLLMDRSMSSFQVPSLVPPLVWDKTSTRQAITLELEHM